MDKQKKMPAGKKGQAGTKKGFHTSGVFNKGFFIGVFIIAASYAALFAAIDQNILNRQYKSVVVLVFVNIILAVSLNLVTGFLGELSLGHAGFMMVGAYAGAIFTNYLKEAVPGMPEALAFLTAVLLGGMLAGIVGCIIGIPVLRLRGDYLAIVTLAFGEIIRSLCENMKITNGAAGMSGINKYANYKHFTYGFVIMVISVLLISNLMKSRHGRAVISIRENYIAAESVGIPVAKFKILAFSIAAFFAGAAGVIYAHDQGMIMPADAGYVKSIDILVIVVLGGMGSIKGSIVAAIVLTVIKEVLRDAADYRQLVYAVVLIAMVIINSSSQFGEIKSRIMNKLFHKQIGEAE